MDKNKSIDGLSPRHSKKVTSSSNNSKSTTNKKSTTKSVKKSSTTKATTKTTKTTTKTTKVAKTAKTTPKTTKSPIATKSTSVSKAPKAPKSTPSPTPTPQASTEDFLKPVQAFNFDEQSGQLVASQEPIKKAKKMKKTKKPKSKKRKIITGIIIAILSILLIASIIFVIWFKGKLDNMTADGNIFDFFSETYEPLKTDENGRTNILAFGTSGYDMEGTEGDYVHDGAQLTDSIMVISLNQETGDVAMLSLPRDLKVSNTCTATGKINEIYWCNNMEGDNDQAGAEALMAEVSDILDIDFQYYTHLNWGSLVSIVNILGGITVTLDEDIDDTLYTGAVFEAGVPYTIDGGQALGLARARHGTASGDFSRGASQQKILIGIKDKIFEKNLSISDLLSLVDTLGDNLSSSFTVSEFKTLAHLFSEFDFNNIRQVSLIEPENYMTTGTINGISYVLPAGGNGYYKAIQTYVAKMFSNDPRVYEDTVILVLNGTDTPGLASEEQANLTTDEYTDVYTDNAPAGEYPNQYTLYTLTDAKPGSQKFLESKYNLTAEPAENLPAGIPTEGYDFILILGGDLTDD